MFRKQVAFFYNSYSAKGKGIKMADFVMHFLSLRGIRVDVFCNQWEASLTDYECAVVMGGDGTFNYFLNYFGKCPVPVLLLAAGTGNDIYWQIYGEASLNEQMNKLVHFLKGNKRVRNMDIAYCILDNEVQKYYINGVGLGFDGEVLRKMDTVRFFGGHLGYLLVVLRTIFFFEEFEYKMDIDDISLNWQPVTLLNIANSSRTGGGFLISPQAEPDDGLLNLLYGYIPSRIGRLKYLNQVRTGRHIYDKRVFYKTVEQIRIKCRNKIPAQIDGEYIESQYFSLGLTDRKLKLIV